MVTKCYKEMIGAQKYGIIYTETTNSSESNIRGGVMMTGKGEPWHTKEEEEVTLNKLKSSISKKKTVIYIL